MSLLLDALNKADQERKRNEATPGINSNHGSFTDHEPRNHSILLIAITIIGFFILLAAIYWLGQRSTLINSPTTSATSVSNSIASAVSSSVRNKTSLNSVKAIDQAATTKDIPDESVTNLYQNTQVPNSNAAITISTPVEPAPTDNEPNLQQDSITVTLAQFTNLPEIHDLPNNIRDKVPTLNYSEHNYNGDSSSVKINGNLYHVNDQISGGIIIDQILEDGILLHLDDYPFKLRALNTWVNM